MDVEHEQVAHLGDHEDDVVLGAHLFQQKHNEKQVDVNKKNKKRKTQLTKQSSTENKRGTQTGQPIKKKKKNREKTYHRSAN